MTPFPPATFLPDATAPWWAWALLPLVVIAGFGIPGHLAFRALPTPLPWVSALVGSLLLLFAAVLGCDLVGIPLHLGSLGLCLLLASYVGHKIGPRSCSSPFPPTISIRRFSPGSIRHELWWSLPCALAFGSVLARGLVDPLSGVDNVFRWNHLALLMADSGSLAHYPPVTAAAFERYPWPDGIPPLISITNLWIYLGTCSTAGILIVARLALELGATVALVWKCACDWWGPGGARLAVLTLASSSLFLCSIGIAQETGLTGVALCALVAFAFEYRRSPRLSTAVWMALAAAVAALCRDYNLLFLPVALALLAVLRAPRRHLLFATGTVVLAVSPWYVRNAWMTGNFLFPHALGGLFSTNPFFAAFMEATRSAWSLTGGEGRIAALFPPLALGLGGLSLGALPACLRRDSRVVLIGLPILACTLLCLLSLQQSAGGWLYAFRVLGPMLPLLAIMSGAWVTLLPGRKILWACVLLFPLIIDGARRHWVYLLDPLVPVIPYDWKLWGAARAALPRCEREPLWIELGQSAQGAAIAADHPLFTIAGARHGVTVVTFFSPATSPLTDPHSLVPVQDIPAALLANGIRFVVISADSELSRSIYARNPRLAAFFTRPPMGTYKGLLIYDLLVSPQPASRSSP